jgi:hypothetical protein
LSRFTIFSFTNFSHLATHEKDVGEVVVEMA